MADQLMLASALVRITTDSSGVKAGLADVEKSMGRSLSHVEKSMAEGFLGGVRQAQGHMGSLAETAGMRFGQIAQLVASPAGAILGLGAAVAAFSISATRSAIEFEEGFEKVQLVLGKTAGEVEHLKDRLLTLTPSMANAKQEAEALANVLASGFGEEASLQILDTAAKLSRVTGVDLNNAVETLTNTLNAYGASADEVTKISNVLFGAFRTAGGPQAVMELNTALGRIIPIASELNIPLEQIVAALAAFRVQTGSTTRGAMGLAQILLVLSANAQKFREQGIDINKVISEQGLLGGLQALEKVTNGNIENMKAWGIEGRTASAVFALLANDAELLKKKMVDIGGSDVDSAMKKIGTDYKQQVLELGDAWDDFKTRFGRLTVPPLTAFLKGINAVLKGDITSTGDPFADAAISAQMEEEAAKTAKQTAEVVREQAQQTVSKRVEIEKSGIEAMSEAERKGHRDSIEANGKMWAENLAVSADARMKELQAQKAAAEARKATALELLAFDKRIIEEQFRAAEEKRQARISTIKQELPLLVGKGGEEKKLREQLEHELRNLNRQGVIERAHMEGSLTAILAKETELRKQLTNQEFEHRRNMGKLSLQEEIAHHQSVARAAKAGSEEQMRALEAVEQKKKELREQSRTASLGVLGDVSRRLEEQGIVDATLADVQREWTAMMTEQAKQVKEVGFQFAGGGMTNLTDLQEAITGAGKLDEANAMMRKFGSFGEMFANAVRPGTGPVTEMAGLNVTDETLKTLFGMGRGDLAGGLLSQAADAGGESVGLMATAYAKAMETIRGDVDETAKFVENRLVAANSRLTQNIVNAVEQAFIRKLMDESARG